MKAILLTLTLIMSFNFAQANWKTCDSSLLTDEALIEKVEAIADELEANDHTQKILNMAFNRSRVIRKKLNWFAPKVQRLSDATDEDIMPLLQDIVTSLEDYNHFKLTLYKVNKHLNKILAKLEDNREAPTEIAVLSFVETGIMDFGVVFFGTATDRTLTITNSGNGTATGITETALDSPFSVIDAGNCASGELAAGDSCVMNIRFLSPTPQLVEMDMVIEYNDGAAAQSITFPLRGRAI